MPADTQERKDQTATAAVTRTEKDALVWVALTLKEPDGVSGLLRKMSITEALQKHDEMRARIEEPARQDVA